MEYIKPGHRLLLIVLQIIFVYGGNNQESRDQHDVAAFLKNFEGSQNIHMDKIDSNVRGKRDTAQFVPSLAFTISDHRVILDVDLEDTMGFMHGGVVEISKGNMTEIQKVNACSRSVHVRGLDNTTGIFSTCGKVRGVFATAFGDFYIHPESRSSSDGDYVMTKRPSHFKHHPRAEYPADDAHTFPSSMDDTRTSRVKRQAYRPRYVEILLVIDQAVVDFHGEDLYILYLMTQMHLVNKIYHHSSLGVEINMVVKKVLIIDLPTSRRLIVEGDAIRSLHHFCTWVRRESRRYFDHDGSHDLAVYITKEDIGPAGYAPVTGMCNPKRSCTVIKDEGISSAFVIAHEMAHVFGVRHDGVRNPCADDATDGRLMASFVESHYDNYYWSDCSRNMMLHYLPSLRCINNKPTTAPEWPDIEEPYGKVWGLDEQCRQEFGESHAFCSYFLKIGPCKKLWCSKNGDAFRCVTKHAPPLPGSKCGIGKWCMKGACVENDEEEPEQGGWSMWSVWSHCSRTCGGGVKSRNRGCHMGSKEKKEEVCPGDSQHFELCNSQACGGGPSDYRAEQCSMFNDLQVEDQRKWLPFENTNASSQCKLSCISEDGRDLLVTESEVVDGTFCSYELQDHICINGKCTRVGCDGKMDSGKETDACGVCGGDGSSCRKVNGVVEEIFRKPGYFQIFYLPQGTRNVALEELKSRGAYIVIKDINANTVLLNGDDKRGESGEFVAHGARFVYTRNNEKQTLHAKGPLLQPMMVQVYVSDEDVPLQLQYQYAVPEDMLYEVSHQPLWREGRYVWVDKGWSSCSTTCDEGVRKEIYECRDIKVNQAVKEGLCNQARKPEVKIEPCILRKCVYYEWETEEWGRCSATCGNRGEQQRYIQCKMHHYTRVRNSSPNYCNRTAMPEYSRPCNRIPCVIQWRIGYWTRCSVRCGTGIQKRSVDCPRPWNSGPDAYICEGEKPADTKICTQPPCPVTTTPTPRPTTTPRATTVPPKTRMLHTTPLKSCVKDKSRICKFAAKKGTCRFPIYQKLCCATCTALLLA